MGEYAIRKSDGVEIKIGTCEEMYYLRYEDREKVRVKANNVDPVQFANELRFRLPFPDEDHILPGDYDQHNRGERLYKPSSVSGCSESFSDESTVNEPGRIQLRHECGLILGIPCYHGIKLPEVVHPMGIFWNGKSWFFELMQLRPTPQGVKPVVGCRHCGEKWRYDWANVFPYVQDQGMRAALRPYVEHEERTAAA